MHNLATLVRALDVVPRIGIDMSQLGHKGRDALMPMLRRIEHKFKDSSWRPARWGTGLTFYYVDTPAGLTAAVHVATDWILEERPADHLHVAATGITHWLVLRGELPSPQQPNTPGSPGAGSIDEFRAAKAA